MPRCSISLSPKNSPSNCSMPGMKWPSLNRKPRMSIGCNWMTSLLFAPPYPTLCHGTAYAVLRCRNSTVCFRPCSGAALPDIRLARRVRVWVKEGVLSKPQGPIVCPAPNLTSSTHGPPCLGGLLVQKRAIEEERAPAIALSQSGSVSEPRRAGYAE